MIVDEASRTYVQSVVETTPNHSGNLDEVVKRGTRRRRLTNAATTVGALVVIVLAMSPLLVLKLADSERLAAGAGTTEIQMPGGFDVAVEPPPVESHGALVYVGAPAAEASFDTSRSGTEVPIERRGASHLVVPPSDNPLESNALHATTLVYLGDVGIAQLALQVVEGDELCIFFGNGTDITGGGYCGVKDTPEFGFSADPAVGWWLVWSRLPEGTAVVQIDLPDGSTYWQRSVARTVVFHGVGTSKAFEQVRATAFDTQGGVLAIEGASYLEGHDNFDEDGNFVPEGNSGAEAATRMAELEKAITEAQSFVTDLDAEIANLEAARETAEAAAEEEELLDRLAAAEESQDTMMRALAELQAEHAALVDGTG